MSDQADVKAFRLLEQAIHKAQESLEKRKHFQPFLMLLTDDGNVESFENELEDSIQSYALLEENLEKRVRKNNIDICILAIDTRIPEQLLQGISSGIRLHLEEKSQLDKKIGARFLYIPYELCQDKGDGLFVKLHTPIPIGFPAEYIKEY